MKKDTSWGKVADRYDEVVSDADSYQKKIILPNILRLVLPRNGLRVLDLACGQGFFSHEIAKAGAEVVGVDISPELVAKAKKGQGNFLSAVATNLSVLGDRKFDVAICVLAIQNIEDISKTFKEVARVLEKNGKFIIVLNHPAFRVPKKSSWGFDDSAKVEYRRVDEYLSESRAEIDMNPAAEGKGEKTISFHRPLQVYSKTLANASFSISRIEEWTSHKQSEKGPRQIAENKARKEIPLFMCLECVKISLNSI